MTLRPIRSVLTALALIAVPALAQAQQADRYAFTQDYEPRPAIWRLSDEDTTIYLFGTIHLLPDGFRWRNPQLDAIIDEADELVVETSDADGDAAMEAISPKLANVIVARTPTSVQLSPQASQRWRELVTMSGMPFDYVDSVPVMVAMLGFGQAQGEGSPSTYENGVETVLEEEFSSTGRPIESIEDFGQILYGLYRVNDAEVLRELDAQLRNWGGKSTAGLYDPAVDDMSGDSYWQMEHHWARGEVQEDFDLGFGSGAIGRAFHDVLLTRRNARWAGWLQQRLEQPGTVLLAVGAGHFEGADSVLVRLRERGLTAERIN
ncbi:MAG: TraB/GumN family protein [Erythrobacter sp.]|nr:TraB/GumN family protein [Erythrobacter sp.]